MPKLTRGGGARSRCISSAEDRRILARIAGAAIFLRPGRNREAFREAALEPELLRLGVEHPMASAPADVLVAAPGHAQLPRAVVLQPFGNFRPIDRHKPPPRSLRGRCGAADLRGNVPASRAFVDRNNEIRVGRSSPVMRVQSISTQRNGDRRAPGARVNGRIRDRAAPGSVAMKTITTFAAVLIAFSSASVVTPPAPTPTTPPGSRNASATTSERARRRRWSPPIARA